MRKSSFSIADLILVILLIISSLILGVKVMKDIENTSTAALSHTQAAVKIDPVGLNEFDTVTLGSVGVESELGIREAESDWGIQVSEEVEEETVEEEIVDVVLEFSAPELPSFDIIVQAGQSNAVGAGIGDVDRPYQPNDNIWYMTDDYKFAVAQERTNDSGVLVGDFALTFADEYINNGLLEEGRKVLIVRAAVGGTGFLNGRWGLEDDLYLQLIGMMSAALNSNIDNRFVAILWSQGEADVVNPEMNGEFHYSSLLALVNNVRFVFNEPNLPFIACDFTESWKIEKGPELVDPILDAIKQVCIEVGSAGFVSADGLKGNDDLLNNGDKVHFNRESLYALGERFFSAFMEIR